MSILEKVRQMPDNQKKIFSLITAAALTLVIVVVWFSAGDKTAASLDGQEESKLSSLSPMQVIKDEFSKAFAGFDDKVAEIEGTSTAAIDQLMASSSDISPDQIIQATSSTSTESVISTSTASTTIN